MEVRFAGRTIKGTILPFRPGPRELVVARTHYPGLAGVSEIVLSTGDRALTVEIVLHDGWSQDGLNRYIDEILQRGSDQGGIVGAHGLLEVDTPRGVRAYPDSTYEGFDEGDPAGIEDLGGTLGGGWICHGFLRFTQLK
jgi:hypothetical protein